MSNANKARWTATIARRTAAEAARHEAAARGDVGAYRAWDKVATACTRLAEALCR